MASVGSLEEEAAKRRERLKAMREKGQQKSDGDAKKQKTDEAETELPKPVFRSYKPKDENLQVCPYSKVLKGPSNFAFDRGIPL